MASRHTLTARLATESNPVKCTPLATAATARKKDRHCVLISRPHRKRGSPLLLGRIASCDGWRSDPAVRREELPRVGR